MFHRFRCLLTTMQQRPKTVETIVMACCILHNLLRTRYGRLNPNLADRENAQTHDLIPGAWRQDVRLARLALPGGNTSTRAAKEQRDYIKAYFNTVGRVDWQDEMI